MLTELRLWAVATIAALLAVTCVVTAAAQHSHPWLLEWIPAYCCVTNDCCWEIEGNELRSLGDDKWEVRTTGQVKPRTNWSPDGKWYRCACDYETASSSWIRHLGANTRCIFVPQLGSWLKS